MSIISELEQRLDEKYKSIKPYLNNKKCCGKLHNMCQDCEQYMGLEQHDYEHCKDKSCFRFYLAYAYLETTIGYELFPE